MHDRLQRPLDNKILTPYQLFEFASQDISGITSFYVNSETVKKTAAILEPRFAKAERIKGIAKLGNHCALKLEKATKVSFTGFFSSYLSPNVPHGQDRIKTQAYGIKI